MKSHNSFKSKVSTAESSPSIYYFGQRKFNIIHAQLRMNCSNLNAHLYNLHVIDSPSCVCSHHVEDTVHFFFQCPLYYTQRLKLRDVVNRFTEFKIETLLHGDDSISYDDNLEILQGVHDFIKDSDRFGT